MWWLLVEGGEAGRGGGAGIGLTMDGWWQVVFNLKKRKISQ
jgi:hypothetical protein